jgi:hypothetical protein
MGGYCLNLVCETVVFLHLVSCRGLGVCFTKARSRDASVK